MAVLLAAEISTPHAAYRRESKGCSSTLSNVYGTAAQSWCV
jgi:hypothetical protein